MSEIREGIKKQRAPLWQKHSFAWYLVSRTIQRTPYGSRISPYVFFANLEIFECFFFFLICRYFYVSFLICNYLYVLIWSVFFFEYCLVLRVLFPDEIDRDFSQLPFVRPLGCLGCCTVTCRCTCTCFWGCQKQLCRGMVSVKWTKGWSRGGNTPI